MRYLANTFIAATVLLIFGILPLKGAEKPNIVLIVADDLGYGDLGCYGSKINQTPHLDALASEGLKFTDFHSAGAMCSPTRAAMLTGQYQQRFGTMFESALSGVNDREHGLPLDAVTIAELLQDQNYATACFGKWHLGYQAPFLPTNQGFQLFRGLVSGDGDFHTHIDRSGRKDWWKNDSLQHDIGYTTNLLTEYSLNFIRSNQDKPFFLYLPHLAIHFPWQGPSDPPHRMAGNSYHQDKWGIIPNPENVSPHVKEMIRSLDESVGIIVAELKKLQIDDNTLVLFTSDNGGYLKYGNRFKQISSNGVLRGEKGSLYEGGHRVPTIAWWPSKINPGVTDVTTHSVDLLPTFCALAGMSTDKLKTDGLDLSTFLFEQKSLQERTLYWRAGQQSAVRQGPWKLYRNRDRIELYQLTDDPREQHNIATIHPEMVKQLSAAWDRWESDVNQSATERVSK